MGAKHENTEVTKAVITRFFEAIDYLVREKTIRGKKTYCDIAGINRRNFDTQKKNVDSGRFQISWTLHLVTDFKISADWLLTGRGGMFV